MTELRDARFKRALDAAPDADVRPPQAIAESLRAAARSAAAQLQTSTQARTPWWRRFWAGTGQPRGPWGAALATVVLGVLVTTLWIGKPLPEPQPHNAAPAPAPEPASERADLAPVAPRGTLQKATEEQAVTSVPPGTPVAKITTPATAPPAAVATPFTTAAAVAAPPPAPREVRTESEARAVASVSAAEAPAALGTVADRLEQLPAAVAAAPAPPVAVAAAAPLAESPLAAVTMAKRALPDPKPDTVVITQQGRSVAPDANTAQRLYALVQSLASQAVAGGDADKADDAAVAPTLTLFFRAQGQPTASFTLAGRRARWERTGQGPVHLDLTDAQVAQLLQLVQEAQAAEPAR